MNWRFWSRKAAPKKRSKAKPHPKVTPSHTAYCELCGRCILVIGSPWKERICRDCPKLKPKQRSAANHDDEN